MASVLQVEGLTKTVGDGRALFSDVSFGLEEGEKVGLIAKNGTGKSTLLEIIAGRISADSGVVVPRRDLRIGYLPQTPDVPDDITIFAAARRLVDIANPHHDEDVDDRLRRYLHQMGLTDPDAVTNSLSGGERKRIALAALFVSDPQLIILDEPTNHLDIETVEKLERWLSKARATLLMVTHDRYFLDRVCTRIIEMDNSKLFSVQGNYDLYLRRRAERIEAMDAELSKVKNILRKEQDWMSRQPQARAGKAKYRIDAFHELSQRKREFGKPDSGNVDPHLVKADYIGSKIFTAHNVSKSFDDKCVLRDFSYTFARYDKVGIIGPNGIGKSTFIKMLQGLVHPDEGFFEVGETVRFGYYSQNGIAFNPSDRVIDAVTAIAEDIRPADGVSLSPMQFLTRFLFTPADQQKFISTLSGGEKCRLYLATVLMRRPNFLILDEPTNDLDIVTLGVLEEYLRDFKGCLIVVSHDRYFLDNIVDHIFVMEGDGIVKDFPGTYTEYREAVAKAQPRPAKTAKVDTRTPRENKPRLTWAQKKELEALPGQIEELTTRKTELERLFASGAPADIIADKSLEYKQVCDNLDAAEMRWLELDEISQNA